MTISSINNRNIIAYTKFQKQDTHILVLAEKNLIPICLLMPSLILHKFIVRAQVYGQQFPTMQANKQKLCGNPYSFLLFRHTADDFFLLKDFLRPLLLFMREE